MGGFNKINNGEGTLGRLMNDQSIFRNIDKTLLNHKKWFCQT
jgi:hypothetical protein